MSHEAVRAAQEELRTFAAASPADNLLGYAVDGPDVLAINAFRMNSEGGRARCDIAGDRLRIVRVFVIEVVFANVDDRQLPKRRHVHHFIEQSLAESAVPEETDRHLSRGQPLGRERCACGDSRTSADDGICAQIARVGVGNVHRSAFAFAIAGFFAEQLGEHPVQRCAFGQAMAVAAMGAGDVIVGTKRFANTDGDCFLTYIKVGEAGHQGARVEVVHLLFEQTNHDHAAVHAQPLFGVDVRMGL